MSEKNEVPKENSFNFSTAAQYDITLADGVRNGGEQWN